MRIVCALATLAVLTTACGSDEQRGASEHGRTLFADHRLSPSTLNRFSCSTCHDVIDGGGARKTGAPLAGVTLRPTFWGGQTNDLLHAINACRRYFMQAPQPFRGTETDAEALYAFFVSLEPGDPRPFPFTIVPTAMEVPRGNAKQGADLYRAACASCHGQKSSGDGRLTPQAPALPDSTHAAHLEDSAATLRLIFIEKTRHGGFLGYGGNMPPFSSERLSDAELGSILEYLGVLGL